MLTPLQLATSRFFLVFVAGLAALAPLAVDMYLPALPDMARSVNSSIAEANLTVSAFMVGMACGQFFGGPLSDQLGRKTIGVIGLILFLVATVGIIFSSTIEQIQLLRVCQAIGGGFASVVGMAQARDIFAPEVVTRKYANIIMVILLAPMIAPTFGAMLVPFGWRAVFWLLIAYTLMMIVLFLTVMPETNQSRSGTLNFKNIINGYVIAATRKTNGRAIAIRYAFFSGFSSGIIFSYVANSSFVFIEYFALSPFQFAATFGLMAALMMIGNRIAAALLDKTSAQTILRYANSAHIITASIMVLICLFGIVNVWWVGAGIGVLIIASGAISPVASGHYIGLHADNIGSAASLNASIMFASGALISALAAVLSHGRLWPLFAIMLVSALIARVILHSADER